MEFKLIWLVYIIGAITFVGLILMVAAALMAFMGPPDLYDVSLEEDNEK